MFRLGPSGPYLLYVSAHVPEVSNALTMDNDRVMVLELDRTKLSREVNEITADAYFQRLQSSIKKLRGP